MIFLYWASVLSSFDLIKDSHGVSSTSHPSHIMEFKLSEIPFQLTLTMFAVYWKELSVVMYFSFDQSSPLIQLTKGGVQVPWIQPNDTNDAVSYYKYYHWIYFCNLEIWMLESRHYQILINEYSRHWTKCFHLNTQVCVAGKILLFFI